MNRSPFILALAWVAVTTIGLIAGGFAFHFPGSIGGQVDWSLSAGVFGLVLGVMTGAAVGVLQWAALLLSRRAGWLLVQAMGLAIGVNHALFDASPFLVSHVLMAIAAGLAVAGAFAWRLHERDGRILAAIAASWAIGIVGADLLSDAIGLPLEETPVGWATDHGFDGLVVGLVWGVATALSGLPSRLRSGAGMRPAGAIARGDAVP
jgi:hypothetical protein